MFTSPIRFSRAGARFALLVPLLAVLPMGAEGQDLVLTNANILDPRTQTATEGSMLIRDGLVAEVGPDITVPSDVEVIDLEGRWIIPGLFDLHTHSFGNFSPSGAGQMLGAPGTAVLALHAGVTGFLDLFSMEDLIFEQRQQQRDGSLPGADIYAAGPCLTATSGHCSEYGMPTRLVDSPEDAVRHLAELAPKQPDVVKLVYDHQTYSGRSMPTVDRATMEAVVDAAHEHGLKTVLHIGTWQDVWDAVAAGADAVTHTPGPELPPEGLARLMVETGTLYIPTLGVQSELGRIVDDPDLLERPLLVEVTTAELIDGYRSPDEWPEAMQRFATWTRGLADSNRHSVGMLAEAGVRIGTGTDGGNPGVFQGYSVHREMELLVAAGLSEWDALAAATSNAADFLGADWGVHMGAEATVVLLDASPLDAIANTQKIYAVIQRGIRIERAPLR